MNPVATWGPMVIETDVDRAVVKTLRRWMPTYLHRAEIERADDLDGATFSRPPAGSYTNTLEGDDFPDGELPLIVVTTAQLQETETTGDGKYLAEWRVVVSAIVRGEKPVDTRAIAALFGGTVRRILIDHQSLGGFAGCVEWVPGGLVAPVSDVSGKGRYLAAGINHFNVYVDDVLSTNEGPLLPDPVYDDPDPDNDPDQDYDNPLYVGAVNVDVDALDRS